MSTIGNTHARDIARGAIKYRRLVDFLSGLRLANPSLIFQGSMNFDRLLKEAGIVRIEVDTRERERMFGRTVFLVKEDGTYFELRFTPDFLADIGAAWNSFITMSVDSRKVIYEALCDSERMAPRLLRYRNTQFENLFPDEEVVSESEPKGLLG